MAALPPTQPAGMPLRKLFDVWVNSDLKAQVIVFYHDNPGVIDTVEGLAKRLGTNVERLREDVAQHVALGLLHERRVGQQVVLVYDRAKDHDIQSFIAAELQRRAREVTR